MDCGWQVTLRFSAETKAQGIARKRAKNGLEVEQTRGKYAERLAHNLSLIVFVRHCSRLPSKMAEAVA